MPIARAAWSPAELETANNRLAATSAEDILRWVDETFGPSVSMACSFGGLSGMVLVDMAVRLSVRCEIFYLDTDVLFPQTYALVELVKQRYNIEPVAYKSKLTLSQQAESHGDELWQRDPDMCCALRKVEPNVRALAGKLAWITGIRREQTTNRESIKIVDWDEKFGLVKINPLADWTETQLREYISEHNVPYNRLLDQGFPSIGCMPCTRAVAPGEDPRAGRWSGLEKTECGLHLRPTPQSNSASGQVAG